MIIKNITFLVLDENDQIYLFYSPERREHYIIELKAGGDLYNKMSKAEKIALLREYFFVCDDKNGFEIVFEQYKKSASYIKEAIANIKALYF